MPRTDTNDFQANEVCIFCALRNSPEAKLARQHARSLYRTYSTSSSRRWPAAATAAQQDDEEELSPMMRHNTAAAANWATQRKRTLADIAPKPEPPPPRFTIPRRSVGGKEPTHSVPQRSHDRYRRDQERDGSQNNYSARASQQNRDAQQPANNRGFGESDFKIRRPLWRDRADSPQHGLDTNQPSNQANVARALARGQSQFQRGRFQQKSHDLQAETATRPNVPPSQRRAEATQEYKPTFLRPDPTPVQQATSLPLRRAVGSRTEEQRGVREDAPTTRKDATGQNEAPLNIRKVEYRRDGNDMTKDENVEDEESEVTEYARPQRLRLSSRFEVEEEQPQLPAKDQVSRARYSGPNTSRAGTAVYDWEMVEAEQRLSGIDKKKNRKKQKRQPKIQAKPQLAIPEFMTVTQLAQAMKVKVDELLRKLEEEGFEGARFDHMLDAETSAMFADIYGFEAVAAAEELKDLVARPAPEDPTALPPRPPIVTIMGHVDHGKTTILDWLRKSSVAAGEHGGITQHIGAFSVTMPGSERQITFLDTPGHEAFLDMRRRGANVTDIVVLVVAADDSVKPQTIEAIKHALEARVQLIVAINKVDKHDANVEQVKQDLVQHDIVVEDFGGEYQSIAVSGKTGQGMEELEEAIITLADVLDLRAERDGPAEGQIIEAKVTNAGRVATVLVKRGTLRVGDFIVAGPTWGRVRTLRNDAGQLVKEARPGDPVQVDGWRGVDPIAGLEVLQADDEQHAKDVVELRRERADTAQSATDVAAINAVKASEAEARAKLLALRAETTMRPRHDEGFVDVVNTSGKQLVHFVVKADVAGSVEAIVAMVSGIGNQNIQANVIHSGTGPVTESDIAMLATTGETAYAISFNQAVDIDVQNTAEAAGLKILNHNIIYRVTDDVKERMTAAMPPVVKHNVLGEAEVGQVFTVTVKKEKIKIAGCKVSKGTVSRSNQVKVLRDNEVVYTGTLSSLKNVKKDVTEMRNGTECGMAFKEWEDFQEGDQVQCYEEVEEKRTLY